MTRASFGDGTGGNDAGLGDADQGGAVRGPALRVRRAGVALAAVLAAALAWVIAGPLMDQRLRVTEESGGRSLEIGLVPVVVLSLGCALAGWALLAVLERFIRRGRAVWVAVALAVLAASFLPLTGSGMTAGTRVSLAVLHLVVAAVLVPGLVVTSRRPTA